MWERLSKIGAKLLVKTIEKIEAIPDKENKNLEEIKKLVGAEKQGENFTLAPMLEKEMAKIDWSKTSREIKNLVRGLNPIMGAYSFLNGKKTKFWKIDIITIDSLESIFPEIKEYISRMKKLEPGTIAFADNKKGIFIKTGDSFIKVLELQGENSKKMDYRSFLNGNKLQAGEIFE